MDGNREKTERKREDGGKKMLSNKSVDIAIPDTEGAPGVSTLTDIQKHLWSMQDKTYQEFQRKLIPTLAPESIIGVRAPALHQLARALMRGDEKEMEAFLGALPHVYFEENQLHAYVITHGRNYEVTLRRLEMFMPYMDNWAICDVCMPTVLAQHRADLLPHIHRWIASDQPYTVRYGLGLLRRFYMEDAFEVAHLDTIAAVRTEAYYVRMMVAWCFATALTTQYEAAFPYIQERRLEPWTHNKAIQKAIDSYCVSDQHKAALRAQRIHGSRQRDS